MPIIDKAYHGITERRPKADQNRLKSRVECHVLPQTIPKIHRRYRSVRGVAHRRSISLVCFAGPLATY